MMAYTPTTWINRVPGVTEGTKTNATNLNNMETGILNAHADLAVHVADKASHVGGQLYAYKNIGGAL